MVTPAELYASLKPAEPPALSHRVIAAKKLLPAAQGAERDALAAELYRQAESEAELDALVAVKQAADATPPSAPEPSPAERKAAAQESDRQALEAAGLNPVRLPGGRYDPDDSALTTEQQEAYYETRHQTGSVEQAIAAVRALEISGEEENYAV